MSKGKIKKPRNIDFPDNFYKKPLEDAIYQVVQTCEVEVENTEWKKADEALKEKLTKTDEKLKTDLTSLDSKLKDIDKRLGNNQGNLSDDIKTLKSEIENLKVRRPLELIVKTDNSKPKDLGTQHYQLPTLIQILSTKLNVYLVGPAGAGKTHAAIQCAKALDIPFHFTGAIASEFKLTGFMDAQGRIVSTEFRKAYENGGLFLFDEIDASYPQAVLAFNAALANDYMDFPDKRVVRHEKFYCIAAANTYGQGADRQYVGRNQLDAASLDRFVFLDWKYDENLERELAGNEKWSSYVQKIRKFIEENKIRHVVSPRASIFGAKLLANGIAREVVEATILWKGLDDATKNKIIEGVKPKRDVLAEKKGEFTAKIKIGTKVNKGDIIGEINDRYDYNERRKNVLSPCNGILAFLVTNDVDEYDNEINVEIGQKIAEIKI
ncbi:MAG: AAA family ATPase [Bacteroidia bacterium]|nr:AAA family ATPase [Bacteroidia bacterium]